MDMTREYFLSTFQLSQDPTEPIYSQLAEYLRYQIKAGVLKPGDKMIGENEIVELLKVSRTTVRSAFNQLVKEGYIVRYRGKGSFISEPKLKGTSTTCTISRRTSGKLARFPPPRCSSAR